MGSWTLAGRIYDAHSGQFVSPIPFIPDLRRVSQGHDRFAYPGEIHCAR